MTDEVPSFLEEANALARVLALAFDAAHAHMRDLNTPAEPDVVRLLVDALEHAYLAGTKAR
jgi:hypothetical protein